MNRTARVLLAAAILGFGATAASAADGARNGTGGLPTLYGYYGNGPTYYGSYAGPAYDGYFVYDYPVYTGGDVTAIAVDLVNRRFHHQRVTGPGVVYYRSYYPRPYRVNPYW